MVWALGESQPFAGFRDPANLLPVVLLLPLLVKPWRIWRARVALGLLLVAALVVASWRSYEDRTARRQPTWEDVGRWIRQNVPKDARFVLTPPGPDNFRILTHRSPVSEAMPALAWVAPALCAETHRVAAEVTARRTAEQWDLAALCRFGDGLGAGYLAVTGPGRPAWEPLYRRGEVRVYACPGEARSTSSQL